MNLDKIISNSPNKELLILLSKKEYEKAIGLFEDDYSFSRRILIIAIQNESITYEEFEEFSDEVADECIEILAGAFILEYDEEMLDVVNAIVSFIMDFVSLGNTFLSLELEKSRNNQVDYWCIDVGKQLRVLAQEIAEYANRTKNQKLELEALLEKAEITAIIFNDSPEVLGPELSKTAEKFEINKKQEVAIKLYNIIYTNCSKLFKDIERYSFNEETKKFDLLEDEEIAISALLEAAKGLERLGSKIKKDRIQKIELMLKEKNS